MFDNLEEICDALQNIFISKKASIIKKMYSLLIVFTINLIGGKEQEINIELRSNSINKDIEYIKNTKLNELENEIKEIKHDKNILLERINNLENIMKNQNNEIKYLKSMIIEQKSIIGKINNFEKTLKEQKREIEKIKNLKKE